MCVAPTRAEAEDHRRADRARHRRAAGPRRRARGAGGHPVRVHERVGRQRLPHARPRERFRRGSQGRAGRRQARSLARRARPWCRWKARRCWPTGTTARPAHRLHLDPGAAHHPGRSGAVPRASRKGQVRVISPDVGGGFGYKCVLQPEELCIAWLALKFRRPFRYIEDRREHLVAGANSRQHHYRLTAYADARGRLLALDAEVTIDGGAYSSWPFTVGAGAGPGDRQPARPLRFPRLSLPHLLRRDATSRAFCPIAASRAPASASRWS